MSREPLSTADMQAVSTLLSASRAEFLAGLEALPTFQRVAVQAYALAIENRRSTNAGGTGT
jgi:hypothetical protein